MAIEHYDCRESVTIECYDCRESVAIYDSMVAGRA